METKRPVIPDLGGRQTYYIENELASTGRLNQTAFQNSYDLGADPAPYVPSFIRRDRSVYGPRWTALQTRLVSAG
jgi:hypothetical protein